MHRVRDEHNDSGGQSYIGHSGGQVSSSFNPGAFHPTTYMSSGRNIREELRQEVDALRAQGGEFVPGLRIVQVGGREDSNVYIRMKVKAAQEIGIDAIHVQLPRSITELELLDKVSRTSISCTERRGFSMG